MTRSQELKLVRRELRKIKAYEEEVRGALADLQMMHAGGFPTGALMLVKLGFLGVCSPETRA